MDLKNVRPLGDRVLIIRDKAAEKTAGGIFIPINAQEKTQAGTVLAVGPGRVDDKGRRVEMFVKKGDRVLFTKYAGENDEKSEHVVVREDDIIGVLTGP